MCIWEEMSATLSDTAGVAVALSDIDLAVVMELLSQLLQFLTRSPDNKLTLVKKNSCLENCEISQTGIC